MKTVQDQRVLHASLVIQLTQVITTRPTTQKKPKVKVNIFSSTNVRDMHDNIKPILRQKPEYIILHVSNNDVLNRPPNEY